MSKVVERKHESLEGGGPVGIERMKPPYSVSGTDGKSKPLSDQASVSGLPRASWEFSSQRKLFFLEEPSPDGIPRCIDVAASFAPHRPFCLTFWIRLFLLLWAVQVLALDVSTYPPHNLYIYMGYLTHWGHVLSICYFTSSLLCLLVRNSTNQPKFGEQPSSLVQTTWGLYEIVAPLEIAITMLYWSAVASGPVTYVSVMEHGVLAALVLMDGLIVGLVPVRAKHVLFLLGVCVAYAVWSILDTILDIGNGEWGPAYNDDALYPVLNWRRETKVAVFLTAFAICVLSPALFALCWLLSLASGNKDALVEGSQNRCCQCTCVFDGSRRPLFQDEAHIEEEGGGGFGVLSDVEYSSLGSAESCGTRCGHICCYSTVCLMAIALFGAFSFAVARWLGYLPP